MISVDTGSNKMLSDKSIENLIRNHNLIQPTEPCDITEFVTTRLQPNSFDLTIGNQVSVMLPNEHHTDIERCTVHSGTDKDSNTADMYRWALYNQTLQDDYDSKHPLNIVNPSKPIKYITESFKDKFLLMPYQFILMATTEILNIPNGLVALVCGRSSVARIAVQTEMAGFIDAGFKGTITLEIINQGPYPIWLEAGRRMAQVYFIPAEYADRPYNDKDNKYNGQIQPTGSKLYLDKER